MEPLNALQLEVARAAVSSELFAVLMEEEMDWNDWETVEAEADPETLLLISTFVALERHLAFAENREPISIERWFSRIGVV